MILRSTIVRELDKVGQGVLFKYQRELVIFTCPIHHLGSNVEEYLEPNLVLSLVIA